EKDRRRRYETANGLASDIRRHLNSEPIAARPPSKVYRFQKSIQRNKVAYAAAGMIALALVLGAMVSAAQAMRARRAERTASRAREQAEAINRFLLEDLLYQATPEGNAGQNKGPM